MTKNDSWSSPVPEKQNVRKMWEELSKAANKTLKSETENKLNLKKETITTTNCEQQQQQHSNNENKIKTSTMIS